jgi:UDP-glucuronate decarboxylase
MTYPSGKKNVLVTGGAGFIGSHLCDELVKTNHVICVDNFITGSEKNIDRLLANPDFKFIRHDINEPLRLESFPELKEFKAELQGVQEIYNLACPTSPKQYNDLPIETLLTNSVGVYNVLVLAKRYKARFLHLSTSAVYGDPKESGLIREDNWGNVNPIGPRSCYNEGKRFAESLVTIFHTKEGVDTKIARVFNTFGPRMKLDDGRMIPDFVVNAILNKPIMVYGTEDEVGSYCYIEDMVEGIVRLMASEINTPVNLGSDRPVHLVELARKIIELTNSTSAIEFKDHLPYTAKQVLPDISLAKESLGWFPMVSLIDGLAKTIENMKVHMKEYKG